MILNRSGWWCIESRPSNDDTGILLTSLVRDGDRKKDSFPETLYIDNVSADSSQVYLRFPSAENNIPTPTFEIIVDLLNYPVGPSDIQLTERMLSSLPEGWEVYRYDEEHIHLVLAETRTLLLPIEPQFTALQHELKVSSVTVEPSSLKVLVKDNKPEKGRTLKTMPINLSRITEPGRYRYESLLEFPPSVRLLQKDREKVVGINIVLEKVQ